MSNVQLYPITPEASNWRELDVKEKRQELAVRIALAAGFVIVLTGMALGFYFSCTTTDSFMRGGQLLSESNAIFCMFPAVFGTGALGGLIAGCIGSNFEHNKNRRRPFEKDLLTQEGHDAVVDLLSKGKFHDIYDKCSRKNGGLGPLVRRGYLSPAQGDELRILLQRFHEMHTVINNYAGETFTLRIITANRFPQHYDRAQRGVEKLNTAWHTIQVQINEHYGRTPPQLKPVVKKEEPRIFPIPTIIPPATKEARNWFHVDDATKKSAKLKHIAAIAGAVAVFIVMAIGIYLCVVTKRTVYDIYGQAFIFGNADLASVPGMFGLAGGGALFCLAGRYNLLSVERRENNQFGVRSDEWDLNKAHIQTDRVLLLTEGMPSEIHDYYYKKHGGIGLLVRTGFLTVSQGEELQKWLREYDANKKTLVTVEQAGLWRQRKKLTRERAMLNLRWCRLRLKIKENFKPDFLSHLSKDMIQHIFSFLPSNELQNIPQTKLLSRHIDLAYKARAREYGGESEEAKGYLASLYERVVTLAKNGYIPRECIVRPPSRFFSSIDGEATLRKLRCANGQQEESVKRELGRGLIDYVKNGNKVMVEMVLQLGANLEERDANGSTPLIIAANTVETEFVRLLLQKGADPNTVNHAGFTPLESLLTAVAGNARGLQAALEISTLLLENGGAQMINHSMPTQDTPLHLAAKMRCRSHEALHSQQQLVNLLLHHKADSTLQNGNQQTAAEVAVDVNIRDTISNFNVIR